MAQLSSRTYIPFIPYSALGWPDWAAVSLSRFVKHGFDDEAGTACLAKCDGIELTLITFVH